MNFNYFELWTLSLDKLFKKFSSSENGLTSQESKKRLKEYGLNKIDKNYRISPLKIFLNQFKNPLIALLIFADVIAYFIGDRIESIIILIIIIFDSLIGFSQEYKAEKTFSLLQKFLVPRCKVLRDGKLIEINTKYIVPGDIIYLNVGDIIPADIRLIYAKNLSVNESSLTGESIPAEKKIIIEEVNQNQNPAYALHIVFTSTFVTSGNGYGVVFATGENSYFGKISQYVKNNKTATQFQKNLINFGTLLMKITLGISIFILIVNTLLGKGLLESIIFALALAIGITPELLPIIITVTLAQGAQHMAKKKVIIKKLLSIENLGNMDILCCDKTGTLTEGKFSLEKFINLNDQEDEKVLLFGGLLFVNNHGTVISNPMDKAIFDVIKNKKIDYKNYKIVDKTEFDFTRRRLSYIIESENEKLLIVKGSPDSVINICNRFLINNETLDLKDKDRDEINKKINFYEQDGYRVIAMAYKNTSLNEIHLNDENELIFLGFLIFIDAPKISAKQSLIEINNLNIELKIITGDSPVITRKICSILDFKINEDQIVTGQILEKLSKNEAENYYKKYNVFARITPEQKYEIIKFLNKENIVGYLGDGINDIPALEAAEVGISVDSAVEVAREVADVVLLKKSLRILTDGIIEGRKSFGNTTKYILNTISANLGNMLTVAAWSIFLPFLPMQPSQILLTNLTTDICLIVIYTDNVDKDFLVAPNKWNLKLISRFMIIFGLISSFFDSILIAPLRFIFLASEKQLQTVWFLFSVVSENLLIFFIRTKKPFFKSRPSYTLTFVILITTFLTLFLSFTKLGKKYLELVKVPNYMLIYSIIVLFSYLITTEIAKLIFFKKMKLNNSKT